MRTLKYLTLALFTTILVTACKSKYKFQLTSAKKANLGEKTIVTLKEENGKQVDSVHFFVNGKQLLSQKNTTTINTSQIGVGKHAITALAFYPNKAKKIHNSIEIFANKEPAIYTYKIINTFPHDTNAYTQGLEIKDGILYETTGKRGKSTLRKVDLKTGNVLQKENLDSNYFGEGMTIFGNKIHWLTWKANKGFTYDLNTFEKTGEFKYHKSREGWGLTHNDTQLIKSDGTNRIWFLDPVTQEEKKSIQAYTNKTSLKSLNELEWIDGKIYANYWQKPLIAIINPSNGVVEGIIDLKGLVKEMGKTQKLTGQDDVLNGIAYDKESKRLFVTGKNWGKLFEIEIIKR